MFLLVLVSEDMPGFVVDAGDGVVAGVVVTDSIDVVFEGVVCPIAGSICLSNGACDGDIVS